MNLFDKLVSEALSNKPDLAGLRSVVEKELLHHDILRTLQENDLLSGLTFIGGTCLRICYGGLRLSEDLDFTGGKEFLRTSLAEMGSLLEFNLQEKYGLKVLVSPPIKDKLNVDTWKIRVETRPEVKNFPAQRINIDICALPSYEKRPMMLQNDYGVDMGTLGLIIQAASREEIFTDKLIAIAFRPNRLKYRDLWDILWLHGQGIKPRLELLPAKLNDRQKTKDLFLQCFGERLKLLRETTEMQLDFKQEMQRFLPLEQMNKMLAQRDLWQFLIHLLESLETLMRLRIG